MELHQQLLRRWATLKTERSSWVEHWREISQYMMPRSGRFITSDTNKGSKKHNNIYDSTCLRAPRVLSAGMMAGMTSPARPWFRLTTSVPELDESAGVKKWLSDVTRLMQMIFAASNTYRALHAMYEELGVFGSNGNIVLSDYDNVIHSYPLTIGEFAFAADYRGQVNTLYREIYKTVGQLVDEFGKEACSTSVQSLYLSGKVDAWVPVIHAIEPRTDRDINKRDNKNMPFRSVYFEPGGDHGRMLRESGFQRFPALCPRWVTVGGDIYGSMCPGMEALGDAKQLQHQQLRKAQGIDYQTKPPVQVPTSMRGQEVNMLPGGVTYVDSASPTGGVRQAFESRIDLSYLLEDIRDVRERINSSFYADLFLMLANNTNPNMTATEVAERHEEKLLMLGPVLERMHNEILDPLIDITFSQMINSGVVPTPPEELQGMELKVEFVSMLAQAQRAIATNSIDRFVIALGSVANIKPEVIDKFDADRWADEYADMLGVSPDIIVPGRQVALIRQQREQVAQAQQQAELLAQNVNTAQALSSIDTNKDSALTNVTRAFSGYS